MRPPTGVKASPSLRVSSLGAGPAVITGGAQGIGRGIAESLLARGVDVVLLDINGDLAAETAKELTQAAQGPMAVAVTGSVTDADAVGSAFDYAETTMGAPRILVNNAGTARAVLIEESPEEFWDGAFDIHVKGTFLCTREFARHYPAGSGPGRIVNVSSVNARAPTEGGSAYCAAKAAMEMFTKVAALELAPKSITVNAVAPGGTSTPMARENHLMRQAFVERTPLARFGLVEDVARVVSFLASEEAGWITGVTIPVDGGLHLRGVHNYHALLNPS
ncbi:SDR family NAD(P)-dependent oxidoreductase [Streptomyces puniciscabiei]